MTGIQIELGHTTAKVIVYVRVRRQTQARTNLTVLLIGNGEFQCFI